MHVEYKSLLDEVKETENACKMNSNRGVCIIRYVYENAIWWILPFERYWIISSLLSDKREQVMKRIYLRLCMLRDLYFVHPCNVRCNNVFSKFVIKLWWRLEFERSGDRLHGPALSMLFDTSDELWLLHSIYVLKLYYNFLVMYPVISDVRLSNFRRL